MRQANPYFQLVSTCDIAGLKRRRYCVRKRYSVPHRRIYFPLLSHRIIRSSDGYVHIAVTQYYPTTAFLSVKIVSTYMGISDQFNLQRL